MFDDTSLQQPQPAELARPHKVDGELRELLAQSGKYSVVDVEPVIANLEICQARAVALARQLDARVAVIAWIQKVSNLILNINAVIGSGPRKVLYLTGA